MAKKNDKKLRLYTRYHPFAPKSRRKTKNPAGKADKQLPGGGSQFGLVYAWLKPLPKTSVVLSMDMKAFRCSLWMKSWSWSASWRVRVV